MWISKRALVTVLAAAIGALSMALATGAFGAPGKGHHPSHPNNHRMGNHPSNSSHTGRRTGIPVIHESLAPSQTTDPMFHKVGPGGLPWVLKRGEVRLKRDGKLDLRVKGLVIPIAPFTGTPGPVTTISASLYCGDNADKTAADTTQQVPISRQGDARIRDKSFSVPATCLAPVILVHPNGQDSYIALDGWRF
jgi:hypothetical protein